MKLRPYQTEMAEKIRAAWASGVRCVLGVLPTGGGKTEVAIELIRQDATPLKRVLVVVDRKVLCEQWRQRMRRSGIEHIGVIQGDNTIALSAPVLVATVQSLRTRGIPDGIALVIVDEAHILHEGHDAVLNKLDEARVLGLTATPMREGLGLRFGTMVVGETIKGLIAEGHLVKPRYFAPKADEIDLALKEVCLQAGDFAVRELSAAMRGKAIMGDVVSTYLRLAPGRQSVAFCVNKQHADELVSQFLAAGVTAWAVLDDTDDELRAAIFEWFEKGEIEVLCSVGVLAIGFDSPVASCAILARPTCSLSLHVQQCGRVLRTHPGKCDALILDHAGNTLRHGRVEDFVPPGDLSQIERASDRRPRGQRAGLWVCRQCEAINECGVTECVECGEPRVRRTELVVLDGDLREVDVDGDETLPGPTADEIDNFYAMALWHAREAGYMEAWAFHATARRFRLDKHLASAVLPPPWDRPEPVRPDDAASRWFMADRLRSQIAFRKGAASRATAQPR